MNIHLNKFLLFLLHGMMSITCVAQDRADRMDLTELISNRGEYSQIRETIGKNLGDLNKYDVIVIVYSNVLNAKAVALNKITEENVNPFEESKTKIINYELILVSSLDMKKNHRKLNYDQAKKLINDAWQLVENVEMGVQKKNLNSMKSLHDENYIHIFCRNPNSVGEGLYGGVLINPIKESKSGSFFAEISNFITVFETNPP